VVPSGGMPGSTSGETPDAAMLMNDAFGSVWIGRSNNVPDCAGSLASVPARRSMHTVVIGVRSCHYCVKAKRQLMHETIRRPIQEGIDCGTR